MNKENVKRFIKSVPPVLWAIIILIIVFSNFSKNYLTYRNLVIILQQTSVLLVVASAATFVLISGGLDLSLGGILTISGVAVALALNAGFPIFVVFLIGAGVGFACGAINGVLISYLGLAPFIVTLGTQGIYFGLSLVFSHREGISISNETFIKLGDLINGKIPMAAILCGILFLFAIFVQNHTRLGRYTYAIGGNREGSRLSGVNTRFWHFMVYSFAGFLTGLAAVILVARLEVADPIVGSQWEFEAIAAAILGGTSMDIGRGDVKGTLIGVLLFTIVRSGMNVIRVPSILQPAILGTILVLAIVLQVSITNRRINNE